MNNEEFDPNHFFFPPTTNADVRDKAQRALWASDYYESLYPYFFLLERYCFINNNKSNLKQYFHQFFSHFHPFIQKMTISRKNISNINKFPKKVDIIVIGECLRESEMRMMGKLIHGILYEQKSICYLVNPSSKEIEIIKAHIKDNPNKEMLFFTYPTIKQNLFFKIIQYLKIILISVFDYNLLLSQLPSDLDLDLSKKMFKLIWYVAKGKINWLDIYHQFNYKTLIIRNHWVPPLCSSAAILSMHKNKKIITLQHGIYTLKVGFIPVIATNFISFGLSSAKTINLKDLEFNKFSNRPSFCSKYVPAGSLFDEIPILKNQKNLKNILVIDQIADWALKFYGLYEEKECFFNLIKKIIKNNILDKVIIRLHPNNINTIPKEWELLYKQYPEKVILSGSNSLTEDLKRSSIVIGLFSGAQTISAASGIPTLFIFKPGWYYTPDLSPFYSQCFVEPKDTIGRIEMLLNNPDYYEMTRQNCITVAKEYYLNGRECKFDKEFIKKILE